MDLTPRTEVFAQADHGWLKSAHGTDAARSATVDISTFTSGTHYPDGYLPDGTPLGQITEDGTYGLYDPEAVDGREVLAGFLLYPVTVRSGAQTVIGALLDHGRVDLARLPVAVAADADIAGTFIFLTEEGS